MRGHLTQMEAKPSVLRLLVPRTERRGLSWEFSEKRPRPERVTGADAFPGRRVSVRDVRGLETPAARVRGGQRRLASGYRADQPLRTQGLGSPTVTCLQVLPTPYIHEAPLEPYEMFNSTREHRVLNSVRYLQNDLECKNYAQRYSLIWCFS